MPRSPYSLIHRNDPRIVIVPEGGLCNRLRVLLSISALMSEIDRPVRLAWSKSAECGAWFEELFLPWEQKELTIAHRHWCETPIARQNLHIPALFRLLFFDKQVSNLLPSRHGNLPQLLAQHARFYASTCYAQGPYSPVLARRLRPLPHLQHRIDALKTQFGTHTIGVHIRRTDNTESISKSPLSAFIAAMDSRPNATFFLSTDDSRVRHTLSQRYGQRLLTQTSPVQRNTLSGMEDAVVDLFTLAQTDELLGSYWSSFTDTAAEMGGMPTTIVTTSSTFSYATVPSSAEK